MLSASINYSLAHGFFSFAFFIPLSLLYFITFYVHPSFFLHFYFFYLLVAYLLPVYSCPDKLQVVKPVRQ